MKEQILNLCNGNFISYYEIKCGPHFILCTVNMEYKCSSDLKDECLPSRRQTEKIIIILRSVYILHLINIKPMSKLCSFSCPCYVLSEAAPVT